ncbi:LysM peptidoglycan-binding domain-containing protein [Neorhizobium lilium]|uniref:LysM peptidoglycan-binding domain-containing protein n=1 Tax=Neorhizobium lilium TaxID=2503024 RepID=A0A3S3TVP5_9HYPH|nr:LysM peptidoglycan-binding domain-containing protein [Neorhizobium lilium]RWX75909.1 LysM peptidoglycan-binding domain-containing protein [Neorhizobium lilium]
MKIRAGWLALIVLVIASLLMVFFVLPRINQGSKPLGDAINAAGTAVQDAVKDGQQVTKPAENAKPADQAAATPSAPSATPNAPQSDQAAKTGRAVPSGDAAKPTPSFDVLRVEPDGSTVIAGRAEPHSTLEVTDGSSVVAKVDVGPSGDFAAVLENPLPPGDHQLVLKATGKDGKSIVSEEVATVSVPTDKNSGKLLAMVTTPGKASRLIATPNAAAQVPASSESASASPVTAPSPSSSTSPSSATPAVSAPAASGATPAVPALPAASTELASNPPSMAPGATGLSSPPSAALATPGTAAELQITAVELEGNKIFVAGLAKTGTTVRGLVDGTAIGQAQPGSDRHFVIEGTADLTVGDHTISVESLNGAGQALVRVEVPFNRPAGEQVAAIAAPAANSPMTSVDGGFFDRLRSDTVRAFNLLQNLYAGGKLPSLEEMTAARSGTSIALKSLSEYHLPDGATASARMLAETTTKDASTAAAALDKLPSDVAAVGAALDEIRTLIVKAIGPVMAQQIAGAEPAAEAPQASAASDGPRTIQQAPLTQSQRTAVIIRRGDTLWQISRRVYGQGVRYTTIYLANEDQIHNPDIIQPGQIFGVPEEYRPDAEELHRQRLQHRKG